MRVSFAKTTNEELPSTLIKISKNDPIDDLLRARLRIHEGSDLKILCLKRLMEALDWVTRTTTGTPFFALRETKAALIELDGRTGPELVDVLLDMNGGTSITPHGLENVPKHGPVVIAATHPIGTFDFIAHAGALREHRPDLKVVAGREAERFLGADLIIAVDLDRKDRVLTARQTMEEMTTHVQSGGAMLIFGSGRVPGMRGGLLQEPQWRAGATRVSHSCNAPIVPASANMRNSRHYYRTRNLFRILSGGDDELGRRVASLRYISELMGKLGGSYDVHYGPAQPVGSQPEHLQELAETLVPGLYRR